VRSPGDWAPLEEHVAVDEFSRIGTFLEVHDWPAYTEMLTAWAASIDSFSSAVRRITEVAPLVFYETEEHHRRGDREHVVGSMTVFEFDEHDRIRRLSVYLQQGS
jgi:hypothetical protein